MKRLYEWAACLCGLALFGCVTFNAGMDYGIDTATCVVMAVSKVEPTGHNPFCDRAQPEASPVKYALRTSWLTVTGNQTDD